MIWSGKLERKYQSMVVRDAVSASNCDVPRKFLMTNKDENRYFFKVVKLM